MGRRPINLREPPDPIRYIDMNWRDMNRDLMIRNLISFYNSSQTAYISIPKPRRWGKTTIVAQLIREIPNLICMTHNSGLVHYIWGMLDTKAQKDRVLTVNRVYGYQRVILDEVEPKYVNNIIKCVSLFTPY